MRTLAVLIAALLLSACAGMPAQSTKTPLPRSEYEIDHVRIARIERQTRMNWGRIVWVSLPTKKVDRPEPEQY